MPTDEMCARRPLWGPRRCGRGASKRSSPAATTASEPRVCPLPRLREFGPVAVRASMTRFEWVRGAST
jgi:hypothetical protein